MNLENNCFLEQHPNVFLQKNMNQISTNKKPKIRNYQMFFNRKLSSSEFRSSNYRQRIPVTKLIQSH